MGLHAQTPAGVGEAVGDGGLRIGCLRRSVHGLEQEAIEGQALQGGGIGPRLGIDQLQLLAGGSGPGARRPWG